MEEFAEIKNFITEAFNTQDNYKVVYTNAKTNDAIIFFSSNGLYTPEHFEETILKKDRYEWENICKSQLIQNKYKIIIFMRDLKYNFYKTGINSELNTQEKVIEKIKDIIKYSDLTTCGSSAGGYMAELVGLKLKAKRIFSIGGMRNEELVSLINTGNPLYYIASYNNSIDKEQYEQIKDKDGVYGFLLNSKAHAIPLEGKCYPYLLTIENERLIKLSKVYKNKVIGKNKFFNLIVPFNLRVSEFLKNVFSIKRESGIKQYIVIRIFGFKIKFTYKNY